MTTNFNKETLFPWPTVAGGWHKPGNPMSDMIDAQVMRLQHLTDEMQKVYSETYDRQIETLSTTGERLTHCVKEMMSSQGATELLNAESQLANTWFEGFAARSQHWLELGQKLQQCYAEFAQASFEDLRKQSEDLTSEATEATAEAVHDGGKQLKAVKASTKHAAE
jgi:exonuclease VII large subunit